LNGLINEIQRGCLDDSISVESLLRRVKLAATKLGLGQLETWVDSELNGYTSGELPDHRKLHGQPAAWNPYNGWIPIQTADEFMTELLSTARVAQSIGSLRDLVSREGNGLYHFPIPPEIVIEINKMMNFQTARMVVQIPRGGIVGIVDFVRNKVLDWSIEMERNGVLGEGFTFNATERESAKTVMTTFNIGNIGNFAGNMGEGNTSGDIALTDASVREVRNTMQQLRDAAPQLVDAGARSDLAETIDAVIVETDKPAPDRTALRGLVQDVRTALTGAAGNLTAEGAIALVGGLLKLLGGG